MPRRRKQTNAATVLGTLLLLLLLLSILQSIRFQDVLFLAVAIGLVVALVVVLKVAHTKSCRTAFFATVDQITDAHIDALVRQKAILVRNDPYGKPIFDKWHAELEYFTTHHLQPALSAKQLRLLESDRSVILQRLDQRVSNAALSKPAFTALSPVMTPTAFEVYCADQLCMCGWAANVTPRSQDQGVDVIAEKDGVRIVLQCKLYSNPVGNKAVQEIAAGRAHQQAHYGAVVTNNTYTASARQLAATNGIHLLHHTDLPQLDELLSRTHV